VIAEGSPDELKAQVGGERLEIKLMAGCADEDAISALEPIARERPWCDDGTLRVPLRERHGVIAEAVRRLDEAGIGIDDIAVRRPTLDDVFLTLTGHAAEPAANGAETGARELEEARR
jgi:ABC-2 type transport system ATP-binding protein